MKKQPMRIVLTDEKVWDIEARLQIKMATFTGAECARVFWFE
jgi:hypothetical protein